MESTFLYTGLYSSAKSFRFQNLLEHQILDSIVHRTGVWPPVFQLNLRSNEVNAHLEPGNIPVRQTVDNCEDNSQH